MKEQLAHQTRTQAHASQQPQQTYGGNPQLPICFHPPQISWQEAAKTQVYDFMEEDDPDPPRPPTSAIRYTQASGPSSGRQATRTVIPQQPAGRRMQAQATQVSQQQPRLTSQRPQHVTAQPSRKPRPRIRQRGRIPWVLYPVVGVLAALALWVGLTSAARWGQGVLDDLHYGMPRTYQVDAVVGHNHDSPAHPSHFVALNLHGQVEVIELPAGDPSKVIVYAGPLLVGSDADQVVVTVSFADTDHDGTPDLVLHVGTSAEVFLNKEGKFVPAASQSFSAHPRGGASS